MSFEAAIGGMRRIDQWFLWKLTWDAEHGKYGKLPCALDGSIIDASKPENWYSYEVARDAVRDGYALGFYLTVDCGYFLFDLDNCVVDGVLGELAQQMVDYFAGFMMEYSSSRKGIHIIGQFPEREIPHRMRAAGGLEFYSEARGIAFGLDGVAQGSADAIADEKVEWLLANYFPPREIVSSVGVRAEWRGPSDDDDLIRRALSARQSAEVAMGGKASFAQLWEGSVEKSSENDMALATRLAFWTGCDEERMERLMLRSGLKRDKWATHRPGGTYLTYTIANACKGCATVYVEQSRNVSVVRSAEPVVSAEQVALVDGFLGQITQCATLADMHNVVIPLVHAANVPRAFVGQLAEAINTRLQIWGAKMRIAELRALIKPSVVAGALEVPGWVRQHCYVTDGDTFFNLSNTSRLTMQGFVAKFGRNMPVRDDGRRENAAEFALHKWGMEVVDRIAYRPDQPEFFAWQGLSHANLYNAASVPETATAYTPAGYAGIEAFQSLLFDMCGRRGDVYGQLISWMAFNVRSPGVKIIWSPIIKGVQGDGKSLIAAVLSAAMGMANVSITGNATLTNSGGFNDWAVRAAVNVIEEIWLVGAKRHELYNAMKDMITNRIININPKGKTTKDVYNVTNHLALTNHSDGLPLETSDRRWNVIFTPWDSLDGMQRYCAINLENRFDAINLACNEHGPELRAWLLGVELYEGFAHNRVAPMTAEKSRMKASGREDAESVALGIVEEGAYGVSNSVISSNCLTNALKFMAIESGFDIPRGQAVTHMLSRMGFSQVDKPIKWDGKTHRVWVRGDISTDNDNLRLQLDATKGFVTPVVT